MSETMIGLSRNTQDICEKQMQINCIQGNQLDCVIEPQDGFGGLYIGNIESAQNIHLLDSLKIRSVLTLDHQSDLVYYNCKISTHKKIKVKDRPDAPLYQEIIPALRFIDLQRRQTNVLVHCFAGVSRSSTVVIAYLMARFGVSLKKAFNYVKSKRDVIQPNQGFMKDLIQFESALKVEQGLGGGEGGNRV